ncbi:MAG: hypothetical protein LBD45_09060, partial [Bacteroidales bacterium]|nr:hypothetical protein [Bacteroidales bacterium]
MLQSMTGYGKATVELSSRKITVEVKSLNSKQMDLTTRLPVIYREKEMEIRFLLSQLLERGKIDLTVYAEETGQEAGSQINQAVFRSCFLQIKQLTEQLHVDLPNDWFGAILRLPDVLKPDLQVLDDAEWAVVNQTIKQAVERLTDFRKQEGRMLEELLQQKIENIRKLRKEVEVYENERIVK